MSTEHNVVGGKWLLHFHFSEICFFKYPRALASLFSPQSEYLLPFSFIASLSLSLTLQRWRKLEIMQNLAWLGSRGQSGLGTPQLITVCSV